MTLTLYQLGPSPNSIKVRLALKFKGLDFETVDITPDDRSKVLEATGQVLTPALVHDGTVVYDSQAILRYLDGNFRDTLRLFPVEREAHRAVETWEMWSKTDLIRGFGLAIGQFFSGENQPEVLAKAREMFEGDARKVEEALQSKTFLCGEHLTAADFTAGSLLFYGCLTDDIVGDSPVRKFYRENMTLSPDFVKTREWVAKVMSYDS